MAYINQKTWNLIAVLFGCGYLLCISLPMTRLEVSKHAFLIGFYKAIPVWMASILSMVGNDSMVGVALVFGSTGDIMLDIRYDDTFKSDGEMSEHLFKLGSALFLIQHILIIYQFASYWKAFRVYSFFAYLVSFVTVYWVILPLIPNTLRNGVCIYSFVLTTSCFLSINALSPHKTLKHERFNLYATLLFFLSNVLVILTEIEWDQTDTMHMMNQNISKIQNVNPIVMKVMIMLTYYAAQLFFANGAYNRYRYTRSLMKRK
eukprot:205319_1